MPAVLEKKKTILEEKNELAIKLLSLKDKAVVHAFKVIFDDLTSTTKKATKGLNLPSKDFSFFSTSR